MLAQAEVEALHQRGVDVPAQRTQHLLHGLDRAEGHPVRDIDEAPTPRGFDHLRREQLRQRPPARLGHRPFGLAPGRLPPVPIVGEQGRQVRAKAVSHKERRTIGRQHLSNLVDDALRHSLAPLANVDGHQQFGHGIEGLPTPGAGNETSA
jgi:hypothetical protein